MAPKLKSLEEKLWGKVERGRTGKTGRKPQKRCQRGHDDWYTQESDGRRRCRICRNAAAKTRNSKDIPDEPYGSEK